MASATGAVPDDNAALALGEAGIALAWTVRGDPADRSFVSEVQRVLRLPLPVAPMTSASDTHRALLWLGPSAWLLVAGTPAIDGEFDAARHAIDLAGGALFDVSASYAAWTISGAAASCTLNRNCPLDLHRDAFRAGQCAQSMLGHVHALFYRPDEFPTFVVMVARSLGTDAWHALIASAAAEDYRIAPRCAFPAGRARR